MKKAVGILFIFISAILVQGCSGGSEGASAEDIEKAVMLNLNSGIEVADVEVQVTDNVGDQIEPVWRARSSITLAFTEDYYERVGTVGNRAVVRPVAESGDTLSGSLITRSTPRGEDDWNVEIERFDIARISGQAESSFGVDGFVIEDSEEHKTLVAEAEEAARKAEEERIRAAEEAETARLAKLKQTRDAMTGTWSTDAPMLYNGAIWSNSNARKMAFEVVIPEGDALVGEGTVVMYDYDSPWVQVEVPVSFKVADDGSQIELNYTRDVKFDRANFTIYRRTDLTLTPDGLFSFPSSRRGERFSNQLEKGVDEERQAQLARYTALIEKHKPLVAGSQMENLPLNNNTYANFLVEGTTQGTVYGSDRYEKDSSVASSVVHAGLLNAGEVGVVKITRRGIDNCINSGGTTRNGITSRTERACYRFYEVELVEKM